MKKLIPFAALGLLVAGATGCGGVTPWEGDWNWDDAIADGELGYIILVGEDGNPEAEDRTKGCIDALNEIATEGKFKAVELERHTCIASDGQAWSDQAAKETVERAVTQYGNKLDFIVSNNDGMAIAAAGVTSLAKGTPIVGFDALSAACDMIKAGTLAGSVSQNGDDQALAAATVLANLIKSVLFKLILLYPPSTQFSLPLRLLVRQLMYIFLLLAIPLALFHQQKLFSLNILVH